MMAILQLAQVLAPRDGVQTVICCGAGGVGKTTTAAALALWAAEHGRRVVVLTIDPARRLAQSMGLTELDNTPTPVSGIDTAAGGSLDAMMLDMKRTFDEVVLAHATPDKAQQIMANPFYQALSTSFAGTSEYMAMEKLGQLREQADGRWDLIVVDTPPSRSALDFLDAPTRLASFLDGRFIRLLTMPARGGRAYLRGVTALVGGVTGVMNRIIGSQLLVDVQQFVTAMDTMFGSFRSRAEQTYARLQEPGTSFLVVATAEADALREAGFFVDRLGRDRMRLAGVLINRVAQAEPIAGPDRVGRAAEGLPWRNTTAQLLRLHLWQTERAAAQQDAIAALRAEHPGVATMQVPRTGADVHDLNGLRRVATSAIPEFS